MKKIIAVSLIAVLFCFAPRFASAQIDAAVPTETTASVRVNVLGSTGPVLDAHIKFVADGVILAEGITNDKGHYDANGLKIGSVILTISKGGTGSAEKKIDLKGGQNTIIAKLDPAGSVIVAFPSPPKTIQQPQAVPAAIQSIMNSAVRPMPVAGDVSADNSGAMTTKPAQNIPKKNNKAELLRMLAEIQKMLQKVIMLIQAQN